MGVQMYKCMGVQVYKCMGVQECTTAQVYKCLGVHILFSLLLCAKNSARYQKVIDNILCVYM